MMSAIHAESVSIQPPTAAIVDRSMTEVCRLLEQPLPQLSPDAIWLSGDIPLYAHMRDIGLLSLANELADSVLCHECCQESSKPEAAPPNAEFAEPYQVYCSTCGWVSLSAGQARMWNVSPVKVARTLASALGLQAHYASTVLVPDALWRLGEIEIRRKRHTVFFVRRLPDNATDVRSAIRNLAAPGAEIVITSGDVTSALNAALADMTLVPLRAIAHIRKTQLVLENLEAFVTGVLDVPVSNETSLRLLHTKRVVLIAGVPHKISPQIYDFLSLLQKHDGDEVHKPRIAEALGFEEGFRRADIFKRHKLVLQTFIGTDDRNGYYWLNPEFAGQEGGDEST